MKYITVSDDLARQISGAAQPVVLLDTGGNRLGQFMPELSEQKLPPGLTPEYLAELERRFENPEGYSTLEEIKARHGW